MSRRRPYTDKEAILYACHRESVNEVGRLLDAARGQVMTASECLRHLIGEHVRVMTHTLEGSSLAFGIPALSPEHQQEIVAARDRYERGLRGIITEGIHSGEFRVDGAVTVGWAGRTCATTWSCRGITSTAPMRSS